MEKKTDAMLAASRSGPLPTVKTTTISAQAMQAWNRIPTDKKNEIINAVQQPSPSFRDYNLKAVKVGKQKLMIRKMSSGFSVIYEPGEDRNTIVSVLTPREAAMAKG